MKNPIDYKLSRSGSLALKKISTDLELSSAWREVVRNLAVVTFSEHLKTKNYSPYHGQVVAEKLGKEKFDFPVDIHAYRPSLRAGGKSSLLQADIHIGGVPEQSFLSMQKFEKFYNSPKNIIYDEFRYKYIIGSVPNPFQKELWMNKFRITRDGAGKSLSFHLPLNSSLDSLAVKLAEGDLGVVKRHLAGSKYLKALDFFRKEGKYAALGEKYIVPLSRAAPFAVAVLALGGLALAGRQVLRAKNA